MCTATTSCVCTVSGRNFNCEYVRLQSATSPLLQTFHSGWHSALKGLSSCLPGWASLCFAPKCQERESEDPASQNMDAGFESQSCGNSDEPTALSLSCLTCTIEVTVVPTSQEHE